MKDKSKRLTVVNTEKKPSEKKEVQQVIVQPSSSSSSHAPGFNPNLYLLKSVWDSVFEIKTDVSGQKYIFGKLPVVTKYGITMYADDGNVEIPQLAEGLPYDQRTIWFNPETKQIEVIGGTGGGVADSVLWDNVEGKPSWITSTKPTYSYSEIQGTPDLSGYATTSALNAVSTKLNDFATILTGKADKSYVDTNFVTIAGTEDVTGLHNFVNGLKVGGIELIQKNGNAFLKGSLVVEGGITMYGDGEGGSSVPSYSTLGSLLNVDESNDAVASVDRVLFQSAGSNVWSWKALSEIGGGSSGGSVSGDYLPLSNTSIPIVSNTQARVVNFKSSNAYEVGIGLIRGNTDKGSLYASNSSIGIYNKVKDTAFYLKDDGGLKYEINGVEHDVLNAGNYSSYALPLSGGTLTSSSVPLIINRTGGLAATIHFQSDGTSVGVIGIDTDGTPVIRPNYSTNSTYYTILHEGNYSSYALPKDGNAVSATKLKTARIIWGQSFNGTANIDGAFYMNNNTHIYFKDASGSNMIGIYASTGNNLIIGNGFAESGHDLYLSGANIYLRYGTSKTTGLVLTSSGNATFSCNILPSATNTYYIGNWDNYFTMANINVLYCGASSNNLWLVGGNSSDTRGVVIGRNSTNTTTGSEICRFNVNGMVWASGVYGDIRTTDTNIYLRRAGLNTNTVFLGNGYFSPYSEASDLLKLGRPNARWNGVYLGGLTTTTLNSGGVVFCDTSNYGLGVVSATSNGRIGIGACAEIYFRVGCTKGADGTITNSSTGAVLDKSANLLVSGGITMYSDQRKKTILNYVELSLKQIADAPLIEHYYNSDQDKTTHVGSIAQYWASMNDWFCKLDNEGFYTMEIQNCALASAISIARHLEKYESKTDKTIRKMKQRIEELENEVERLKQN